MTIGGLPDDSSERFVEHPLEKRTGCIHSHCACSCSLMCFVMLFEHVLYRLLQASLFC